MRGNERWTPRPRSFRANYLKIRSRQSSSPSSPGWAMGRARSRRSSSGSKGHRGAADRRGASEPVMARIALDRVSRGARGDLFARDSVRVARAMAVAPAHQIDVDVVVVIDVRAGRQHRAELIAGRGLHVAQKALLLRQSAPTVLHRDLASI